MRSTLLLAFAPLLLATPPADAAPIRGKKYEKLALVDHPDQHYALYLPEGARERPFPLLVVLDPRGRALEAMDLFLPTAQRLGWIVASSYDSLSDEGSERNAETLPALLLDLEKRMVIDEKRVYFAGFSGTARAAFGLASAMGDHAAGVIASCGTLPAGALPSKPSFAYFGATGTLDFNYGETLDLAADFEKLGATSRFEVFAGEHSWAPPEMVTRALLWLELQAMKKGLRPRDPALIQESLAGDLAAAEAAADPLDRLAAYRKIERDFAGLAELGELPARREALEKDKALRAARKERAELLALEAGYRQKVAQWREAFTQTELPLPLNRSLSMLLIPSLQHDAEGAGPLALSAQRRLRIAFSEANHYLPSRLLGDERLRQAAASYELATRIRPEVPRAFLNLARAELQLGREDEARKAWERATALGFADFDQLPADDPLRRFGPSPAPAPGG